MFGEQAEKHSRSNVDRKYLILGGLIIILMTALLLRLWRLGIYGYGNEYYAAAVKSMLQSWHNFFFVAAEPGGSVMVDKPPLGLWLQAVSAWIFGLNGFSLALPSALAGTLSVYILFLIVNAVYNHQAALASAFFLAVLPGVVWVDRTNLLDSLVMCSLMVAVWLLLNAIMREKWWLLVASFAVIGLGFNIKMLQAYLILPAMGIVYFLSVKTIWWKRLSHLMIATVVMLLISFSWVIIVDIVPEENRPYVSSTESNKMMELVFGHNGLNRLINLREQMRLGISDTPMEQALPQTPPAGSRPGSTQSQQVIAQSQQPQNFPAQFQQLSQGHSSDEIGDAGILRLFQQPLAQQVSWLLGFALISLCIVPFLISWQFPLKPAHQLYLLLSIWLITEVIFFSVADFFHAYYLLMLGAPIAGLCGLGIWAINQLWDDEYWKGFLASITVVGMTFFFNSTVLTTFGDLGQGPKTISGIIALLVIIGLAFCMLRRQELWRNVVQIGIVLFLGSASFLWTIRGLQGDNPVDHNRVTGAGSYVSIHYHIGLNPDQQKLLTYLIDHTDAGQDLMLVNNSSAAAPFVLASGRGVFTAGGFTGRDPVVTDQEIIEMIESGEIRFIFAQMDRNQTTPALMRYYQKNCQIRIFGKKMDVESNPVAANMPLAIFDCLTTGQ